MAECAAALRREVALLAADPEGSSGAGARTWLERIGKVAPAAPRDGLASSPRIPSPDRVAPGPALLTPPRAGLSLLHAGRLGDPLGPAENPLTRAISPRRRDAPAREQR